MWFRRNKDIRQTTTLSGTHAETRAEHYLIEQGLTTYTKNFRTKQGEIDLVMRQGNTVIFVEVRMRNNPLFSSAAESVDSRKQQKIIRAAQHFLQHEGLIDKVPCRFDVVAINQHSPDANAIQWIQNAFIA